MNLQKDWERFFEVEVSSEYVDNLKKILNDQNHNLYSIGTLTTLNPRSTSTLIVKTNTEGKTLWSKTFQCESSSSDMLAADIYRENLVVASDDCLFSFDLDGNLSWQKSFSKSLVIHDLKIIGNLIYILGDRLQVFTLNGDLIYTEEFEKNRWSMQAFGNQVFIAGSGAIDFYTPLENKTKRLIFLENQSPPAQVKFYQNTLFASFFDSSSDQITLGAYDLSGRMIWQKKYENTGKDTYKFPGAPQIQFIDNKLCLIMSKYKQREVVLINPANGAVLKKVKSKKGIVETSLVVQDKALIIFGENDLDVYDSKLSLLANYKIPFMTLITAGDFVIDDQKLYIGTSVLIERYFRFYLAQISIVPLNQ